MYNRVVSFFSSRIVPVEFRDVGINKIDKTLFDQSVYSRIVLAGNFSVSPAGVMHAASVHYQARYDFVPLRVASAGFEIFKSFDDLDFINPYLCMNSSESSEFQAKSSEVIAIGMSLALCKQLFGIKYNEIFPIETTKKRCDFSFVKSDTEYVVEIRGRKSENTINTAIKQVFAKKVEYKSAKYGFVCHLPREGLSSSIVVVDPPIEGRRIEKWELASKMLKYYSWVTNLAGLWRLSSLLNTRSLEIAIFRELSFFEAKALDFENIEKIGKRITIGSDEIDGINFYTGKEPKYIFDYQDYGFILAIDNKLMNILISQKFDDLFQYLPPSSEKTVIGLDAVSRINDDGTIFAAVPKRTFEKAVIITDK